MLWTLAWSGHVVSCDVSRGECPRRRTSLSLGARDGDKMRCFSVCCVEERARVVLRCLDSFQKLKMFSYM